MFSNKIRLFSLILGLFLVAGCQQPATHQALAGAHATKPAPVEPRPPVSARQYAQQQRQVQAQPQAQQTVITVHLAQEQPEASLIAVEVDDNQALYALPQPVLTQADMQQVTPVTTQDGSTFIMFDLTPQGRAKLANVSTQATGHYFLVSASGQLVSVTQIAEPMTEGKFLVSTQGMEHSRQILQLLR